jgi:hypothetical protein
MELPELAEYVAAGLAAQGESVLAEHVATMRVHACSIQTRHASLHGVDAVELDGFMENPRRKRYAVGSPRGVKRRSWVITLDVIGDVIYVLAISHPSVLRPKLLALCER